MQKLTASIVIYKEDKKILKKSIESFLSIPLKKELIVVDNSPSEELRVICESFQNIIYIKTKKNIGFGAGHNLAFQNFTLSSDIHLIINPDTYFTPSDIKEFLEWFFISKDISLATPKVRYPDGSVQNIARNIPTPLSLIKRRLNIDADELMLKDNSIEDTPFAHGCFMVFKTEVFKKLDGFDERFFMYMEDIDIFIRAKNFGRTVINTNYNIYHHYKKESSKSIKLLYIHMVSAVKFFLKTT